MSYHGKFITFEGGEGSGKSTQAALLAEALKQLGAEVLETREPGGTVGAERIRELVLNKEMGWDGITETLLMFAARRDHLEKKIKPALHEGQIVLCDRYTDSTLAYQGLARGLGEMFVETINTLATAEILPDMTILLDVPAAIGLKRAKARQGGTDTFESQALEFHERVREGFIRTAEDEPHRFLMLDGTKPIDALHDRIVEAVNTRFGLKAVPYKGKFGHTN